MPTSGPSAAYFRTGLLKRNITPYDTFLFRSAARPVFGAIAHFERRLIAERTRDGVAAARAGGRNPGRPGLDEDKLQAALTLVRNGLSPTKAVRQVGLGRSTLYRELAARQITTAADA